ncbi:MAG: type II toxin-antitoxin system HicB family antitoxin [Pseudomonadota bacterium]
MNILNYKGYTAKIEFDPDDNILFGNIIGVRDTVGFHGESVIELKKAFHEAVDFYLESCEKVGRTPDKPFSGNFTVRVDSSLHAEIAAAAAHERKSLNQWISDTLNQVVHSHENQV